MNMDGHMHHVTMASTAGFPLVVFFSLLLVLYLLAIKISNRKHKKWPLYRSVFWAIGTICAVASLIGPIATRAHTDFNAHMITHLLLGMLAPLLMVLACPMTLLLRTLKVDHARHLTRLLQAWPVRLVSHPVTASILNIGGLWILYTTDLYSAMHQHVFIYLLVHLHIFLAGYFFTASMIYMDITPHRVSFPFRTVIFILSLSGHGILSKYLYANPPSGIASTQAKTGAMLMYYAGDIIDLVIISLLCLQWYKATRPRHSLNMEPS